MSQPDESANDWMVRKHDGRMFGPTSLNELKQLASKGVFVRGDHVRGPNVPWTPVHKFKELQAVMPVMSRETTIPPRRPFRLMPLLKRSAKWIVGGVVLVAILWTLIQLPWRHFFSSAGKSTVTQGQSAFETLLQDLARETSDAQLAVKRGDPPLPSADVAAAERAANGDNLEGYRQAALGLKQALLKQPENAKIAGLLAEVTGHLALLRHDLKMERRALLLAENAIQIAPTQPYGYRAKILVLQRTQNAREAQTLLIDAYLNHPDFKSDSHLELYKAVNQLLLDEQPQETRVALQRLVATNPQLLEAANWLAEAYLRAGDFFKAQQILQGRLKADRTHPLTLHQLGYLNEIQRQYDLAITYYQQALRAMPYYVQPRLRLSYLSYQRLDNLGEALRNLNEINERYAAYADETERKYVHLHLCNLYYLQHDTQQALEQCSASLKAAPYFVPALLMRASLLREQGDVASAMVDLQNAQPLARNDLRLAHEFAAARVREKQSVEALRFINEASAQRSESLMLLLESAQLYLQQGQADEAERLLRRGLGDVYWYRESEYFGSVEDTLPIDYWSGYVTFLRQLTKVQPKQIGSLTALGAALGYTGDTAAGIRTLEAALKVDPDYLPAAVALADLWNRDGDENKTLKLFGGRAFGDSEADQFARLLLAEALLADRPTEKMKERARSNLSRRDTSQLGAYGCRFTVAQLQALPVGGGDRREALEAALFVCAAEPIHYYPATALIMSGATE